MPPRLAGPNGIDITLSSVMPKSDCLDGVGATPNILNRLNGQFGSVSRNAGPDYPPMAAASEVLPPRGVFQVRDVVVRAIPVPMIDVVAIRSGADERFSNQRVYTLQPVIGRLPKMDLGVARDGNLMFQDRAHRGALRWHISPHPTTRGHGVPAFVADHGAPLFGRGTLTLHRDTLQGSRGATPEAGANSARASSCLNFTTPDQMRRAA